MRGQGILVPLLVAGLTDFVSGARFARRDHALNELNASAGEEAEEVVTFSFWKLAKAGQTCTSACQDDGAACSETDLRGALSDSGVRSAASAAGRPCSKTFGSGYPGTPGICTDGGCCGGSCVGACAYGDAGRSTCGASPASSYQRLCPCKAETPATLFLMDYNVDPKAVLAAIPASARANGKKPALLVIPQGGADAAVKDFLDNFQPAKTYIIGSPALGGISGKLGSQIKIPTALSDMSLEIARQVWTKSGTVVIAKTNSYEDILIASSLAAKLSAPLLLESSKRPSSALKNCVQRLRSSKVIFVGSDSFKFGVSGVRQESLRNASAVFDKIGKPSYLAVANPADTSRSLYRGLSAFAGMLAALRGGAILPITGGLVSQSEVHRQVKSHVSSKGIPKYLALVGGFEAIPLACKPAPMFGTESCYDAPYAEYDSDPFLDVALGRVIARDIASMSLLVSRIANYERIRGGSMGTVALAGQMKMTMQIALASLKNAGFGDPQYLPSSVENGGSKIQASAIIHKAHSHYGNIGGFYKWNTPTLLAPSMVTSGGCNTNGFHKPGNEKRSAVLQILHNGAIGFTGGTLNKITQGSQLHEVMWDYIGQGKTLGEAHIEGWNTMAVDYATTRRKRRGILYALQNTLFLGDPAFRLYSPQKQIKRPARASVSNSGSSSQVTVLGPDSWTKYTIPAGADPLPEWGWSGNLYEESAPGVCSRAFWGGKYDRWEPYFYVKVKGNKAPRSVRALDSVTSPLGYGGKFVTESHPDGSVTVWWAVRMLDYSWPSGNITSQVNRQRYEILWS